MLYYVALALIIAVHPAQRVGLRPAYQLKTGRVIDYTKKSNRYGFFWAF